MALVFDYLLGKLRTDNGIVGPPGPPGSPGADGADGADGANGINGTDGREVEVQKTATHIQWRYVGEETWTDLVALADITGPAGDDGADGVAAVLNVPSTDLTVSSHNRFNLTAGEALAFGDVVRVGAGGKMVLAKADAIANASGLFMCVSATVAQDASGVFMGLGIARNDAWDFTPGGIIFLSSTGTTGNTLTHTPPTTEDSVTQALAVALTADIIIFNPSLMQIEYKA